MPCTTTSSCQCAGSFLLLAGAGNLTKAVGKGLGKPSFRIIQNHFALRNNLGDISAKEEASPCTRLSWPRTAMLGLEPQCACHRLWFYPTHKSFNGRD